MIPRSLRLQQPPHWQTLLAQAITEPEQLLRELDLPLSLLAQARRSGDRFRLRVPRGFLRRMRRGDQNDPLLRQVLPLGEELDQVPGYSIDPLAEMDSMPAPGVLHKYQGRVLLTTTGACAVHCRYCFRRHYPYHAANPRGEQQQSTLRYLREQSDISEVILSGGDPLSLSDAKLQALVSELESVPQLTRLRIHSRVPVVLPERVEASMLEWIGNTRFQVILVIHCNHPNEIDSSVEEAMKRLRTTGVLLLNQSVLLRGVNDCADTLVRLSEKLAGAHVLPYYLHQLDPVQGAAHFAVEDAKAKNLIDEVHGRLSGYLVPRLVRERPGQRGKSQIL
jgi:EF-P beta-lysylation protein EpmB